MNSLHPYERQRVIEAATEVEQIALEEIKRRNREASELMEAYWAAPWWKRFFGFVPAPDEFRIFREIHLYDEHSNAMRIKLIAEAQDGEFVYLDPEAAGLLSLGSGKHE